MFKEIYLSCPLGLTYKLTNSNIALMATTVRRNISHAVIYLIGLVNTTNIDIMSVAVITERNISQLSTQLDVTNSNIRSLAISVERNVSNWLDEISKMRATTVQKIYISADTSDEDTVPRLENTL